MPVRRQLLVEGTDAEHVIKHICGNRGFPEVIEFENQHGADALLESLPVRLKAGTPDQILGVVMDADTDIQSR